MKKTPARELINIPFPACSKTCAAIGKLGASECSSICIEKFPCEIIDEMLCQMCVKEMALYPKKHLTEVQNELSKFSNIKNALKYLKKNPGIRTLGHTAWIERVLN